MNCGKSRLSLVIQILLTLCARVGERFSGAVDFQSGRVTIPQKKKKSVFCGSRPRREQGHRYTPSHKYKGELQYPKAARA